MFRKPYDVLCVGDIATDAFIRLEDPHIHTHLNHEEKEICLPFASKIPFEYVKVVKAAGNAANAAVATARLGLRSALVSNVGDDENGKECLKELMENGVVTSHVRVHRGKPTNYHFVLWYESERTILVNHTKYDCHLSEKHSHAVNGRGLGENLNGSAQVPEPNFKPPKWMYLTSMAADTYPYHMEIADYLEAHPEIKLAFQPGTYQIKLGPVELKRIYARTEFLAVNLEEAARLLNIEARPRGQASYDPHLLVSKLAALGPKLVAITDGPKGAYLYDGDHTYFMPPYPDPKPPFERTGCGDAWTSTFISALALGLTPLEALTWAAINPMSVAQYIGAQEGLLTREQLEWWLKGAPGDYKPREI